jgi:hypothetical protein
MWKYMSFAMSFLAIIIVVCSLFQRPKITGTSGYWRIIYEDNTYWFLSPDGNKEFMNVVQSVQPQQSARDSNSLSYLSKDFHGDLDDWARKTANRVSTYGFKGIGAWSNPSLHPYIPFTRDLNLSKWTKLPISDPNWETDVEKAVKEQRGVLIFRQTFR